MPWHARIELDYRCTTAGTDRGTTVVRHTHQGPLRVFKSLYPEGPGVCHNIIVHPPGGLVEGDRLDVSVRVRPGAHALISTPGATRFYRSTGEAATQDVRLNLESGARCEWLPLETIAYDGCQARNQLEITLAPGAELIAWEVLCLGLPGAGQPMQRGVVEQRFHWPGVWLDRARVSGDDQRLLLSPTGIDGQPVVASLVLACGTALERTRREHLLQSLRTTIDAHVLHGRCGATCLDERLIVIRALAPNAQTVMELWQALWGVLRREAWQTTSEPPRIWRV